MRRKKCSDCQRLYFANVRENWKIDENWGFMGNWQVESHSRSTQKKGKPSRGRRWSQPFSWCETLHQWLGFAPCASSQLLPLCTWMPQALGWEWLAPEPPAQPIGWSRWCPQDWDSFYTPTENRIRLYVLSQLIHRFFFILFLGSSSCTLGAPAWRWWKMETCKGFLKWRSPSYHGFQY
jgi:hypothetical protein